MSMNATFTACLWNICAVAAFYYWWLRFGNQRVLHPTVAAVTAFHYLTSIVGWINGWHAKAQLSYDRMYCIEQNDQEMSLAPQFCGRPTLLLPVHTTNSSRESRPWPLQPITVLWMYSKSMFSIFPPRPPFVPSELRFLF